MDQKVIYIAGPYRSNTEWGVLNNIRSAEAVALKVWSLGAAAICPHKNTAFFGGALPDSVWLDGDQAILLRCDAVILVDGWETSIGATHEVALAKSRGIPVFETPEELAKWLSFPQ